jgi:hypothetical protein
MAGPGAIPAYHPVPAAFTGHLQEPTPPSEVLNGAQARQASSVNNDSHVAERAQAAADAPDLQERNLDEVSEPGDTIRVMPRASSTS